MAVSCPTPHSKEPPQFRADVFPALGNDDSPICRTNENLQRSWLVVNETLLGKRLRLNLCGEMGGSELLLAVCPLERMKREVGLSTAPPPGAPLGAAIAFVMPGYLFSALVLNIVVPQHDSMGIKDQVCSKCWEFPCSDGLQ